MNLLLDTNILIHLVRNANLQLAENLIANNERIIVPVILIAELRSIALKNDWGHRKLRMAETFPEKVAIVEVNEGLVNTYAEIDAYSQRRNPHFTQYPFSTPATWAKTIYG